MNAKILIIALCAFQLAAGQFPLNLLSSPLNMLSGIFGGAQDQTSSAQQQFTDMFQLFSDNFTSQMNFFLGQFDDSSNEDCKNNLTQQAYALGNQTFKLFKAGVSIVNETIRNTSMLLVNVSRSMQNATMQAMSNYTACVNSRSGGLFAMFTAPATCGMTVATQQFPAFVNTMTTSIQNATRIASQLLSPSNLDSTVHTLPQMAGLGANLTATFATQLAALAQQAMKCIAGGMNSTATGFSG